MRNSTSGKLHFEIQYRLLQGNQYVSLPWIEDR